ncbi:MAG: plasmid pRiA4b ORF-3 family protein [Bacteroidales bacterium]|nr:plasmid pRiA4b ORF-3 family protein [Bacteroidales bacterium]
MIFKFSLVSDEVANFRREIQIDGDDTFFDLHKAIMECSGYEEAEITSFFMCDDWWVRKQEISLIELDTDSDVDVYVMEEETLSDWLDEEKQKMRFVFDYSVDRGFFMELSEMILGEYLSKPICTNKIGDAPVQFLKEEEVEPVVTVTITPPLPLLDEDVDEEEILDDEIFYGDDDFNPEELDTEGFGDLDMPGSDIDNTEDSDLFK